MSRPQLQDVTLCIIDCLDADRSIKVLEHCKKMCDFGAVKFLTSIPVEYEHAVRIMPLNSLVSYSIFMLTRIHEYIDTPFLQIVQRDGWILNPQSWKEEWKTLDFIGPLYMQETKVGSGGFSFRSKKIMQAAAKSLPEWDGTQAGADRLQTKIGLYEDGYLSLSSFSKNFRIASLEQAADYSQGGNRNPKYFREKPYGFHRTFQTIDFKTGRVDSSDTTRDITQSYHDQIDLL